MLSTPSNNDHAQNVTKKCDTRFPANKLISRPRTLSFSSSSSSSSSYFAEEDSLPSPGTPLSGIPFSWEKLPGIPKKTSHKKKDTTLTKVLPLPPLVTPTTSKRFNFDGIGTKKRIDCNESFRMDPFFAALVECSKDDHHQEASNSGHNNNLWGDLGTNKVTRSLSDRFGFISLYTASCKRTCTVSDSIVYLPRSTRTSYDLIPRSPR